MLRAKVDANQPQIVKAFRAMGCSVLHLHTIGHGCPDILVGYRGLNYLFEIKDGDKPPSKQALTPDEQRFFTIWTGQVKMINSINFVERFVKDPDKWSKRSLNEQFKKD